MTTDERIDAAINELEGGAIFVELGCDYDYRPYKRYAHLAYEWLDKNPDHYDGDRKIRMLRIDVGNKSGERMSETSCAVAVAAHPAFELIDADWYRRV